MKLTKSLIKRSICSLSMVLLSLSNISLNGTIGNAKSITNYEDILGEFTQSSIEYQQTELELQKYLYAIPEYQHSVERYKERMNQVNMDSETLEDVTAEYENSLLQVNIYSFYEKHGDIWLDEKLRNLKYDFLSDYLQLPVLQTKIDYYDALLSEYNDTLKITQALNHSGYATKLEVEKVKTLIVNSKTNKKAAEDELDYLKLKVGNQLNDPNIHIFSLSKISTVNKLEDYIESYSKNNTTLLFLEKQVKAYEIYKTNMESRGEVYIKYVNKSDIELKLLALKQQQYKLQETLSINKTYHSFQNQPFLLEAKDAEIAYTKLKKKEKQLLYKKGKAKKIEITQLNTELEKLTYEREYLLYQQNMAYFTLLYNIVQNN